MYKFFNAWSESGEIDFSFVKENVFKCFEFFMGTELAASLLGTCGCLRKIKDAADEVREHIDEVKTNVMEISGEVCTYAWQICDMHIFMFVCVCVRARVFVCLKCMGIAQYMHMKTHLATLDLSAYVHVRSFRTIFRTSCSKTKFSAMWKHCTRMRTQ